MAHEVFLSVGLLVHDDTDTSAVVSKLPVDIVSQIVSGVVDSDTVDVLEVELGFRRFTIALRRSVAVGHRVLEDTQGS